LAKKSEKEIKEFHLFCLFIICQITFYFGYV